ncbi:hypothetical protein E4U52_001697 [Claviceps spartinae]|nr:hypothetical protein E4U52_001697 [Claviceps spartinae]
MPTKKKCPVYVLGVGMTKFIKPRGQVDYTELGFEAGIKALLDAHITYDSVEQGIACYCYGDSTCGQRIFYQFGMTKIPPLQPMGRNLIASGAADCIMVVGFEKMRPGLGTTVSIVAETRGWETTAPGAAQMFGNAGREYKERYGAQDEDFAEIARVSHAHSSRNPYAQFREVYSLEQIMQAPGVFAPLTKLQRCPTSDGGAAAILVSQAFLDARPEMASRAYAVQIAGQCLATDGPSLFSRSAIDLMGYEMTQYAVRAAMAEAHITPADVQVVELHDCFSANQMIAMDALGLCETGKAHGLVRGGDITYGGKYVINPSGGLISKGHPLGATGIAQCAELVWHLRGWANTRASPRTRYCLQHNLGLGGAVVVTVYRRPDGQTAPRDLADDAVGKMNGLRYNPATEAKMFTREEADRVRSMRVASEWALADTQEKLLSAHL